MISPALSSWNSLVSLPLLNPGSAKARDVQQSAASIGPATPPDATEILDAEQLHIACEGIHNFLAGYYPSHTTG